MQSDKVGVERMKCVKAQERRMKGGGDSSSHGLQRPVIGKLN